MTSCFVFVVVFTVTGIYIAYTGKSYPNWKKNYTRQKHALLEEDAVCSDMDTDESRSHGACCCGQEAAT